LSALINHNLRETTLRSNDLFIGDRWDFVSAVALRVAALRTLFIVTAVLEVVTGLGLLAMPAPIALILLGSPLDTPASFVVARVAGAALAALGLACWKARVAPHSRAAAGITAAMLVYNGATVAILVYASIGLRLSGIGLWPATALHLALAIACVACLRTEHMTVTTADNRPPDKLDRESQS
jgi:hypothetical protein